MVTREKMNVSVLIPTYNEEGNISKLITAIQNVFSESKIEGEIIVIDDNSPDGTWKIVRDLERGNKNLKLVKREKRMGIASALLEGAKISKNELVLTMDADFSHHPHVIPQMLSMKGEGNIVIGSRYLRGKMKAPFLRILSGLLMNIFANTFLNLKIKDSTGGFLVLEKNLLKKLHLESRGGEYSIELLSKARKLGYDMVEIPIVYNYREAGKSKTSLMEDGIRYIKRILKLRFKPSDFV